VARLPSIERPAAILALLLPLASVTAAPWAAAHPTKGKDHHHEKPEPPTKEQIDKRLERVIKRAEERQQKREERRKDRRAALRRRMFQRLQGKPLTPDIKHELTENAQRTAQLRHIRYIAAKQKDWESVLAADRALAHENARHEAWWRAHQRAGKEPKSEGSAKIEGAPSP
jgi:hypothetical protein